MYNPNVDEILNPSNPIIVNQQQQQTTKMPYQQNIAIIDNYKDQENSANYIQMPDVNNFNMKQQQDEDEEDSPRPNNLLTPPSDPIRTTPIFSNTLLNQSQVPPPHNLTPNQTIFF